MTDKHPSTNCQAATHVGVRVEHENIEAAKHLSDLESTCGHYQDTLDDYWMWSPEGNLHFGYWRLGINPFHRAAMLAEMNTQVLSQLGLQPNQAGIVADLGCGVTGVCRYGVQHFPNIHWHAFNVSIAQLQFAKSNYDMRNITTHCLDYHHLPWHDPAVDGAYFVESLCYSLKPAVAVAEAARVLKSGSKLVVTDGFLRRPLQRTSTRFQYLMKTVANNWAVPAYHEIADVDGWATQAGLELVGCREIGWQIAPCVLHSLPLTLWCALQLKRHQVDSLWRWRQLRASSFALLLGLHRSSFGYYLITFAKP